DQPRPRGHLAVHLRDGRREAFRPPAATRPQRRRRLRRLPDHLRQLKPWSDRLGRSNCWANTADSGARREPLMPTLVPPALRSRARLPLGALTDALRATGLVLPLILVVAYGVVMTSASPGPAEMAIFGPAGAHLLTGHWSEVY